MSIGLLLLKVLVLDYQGNVSLSMQSELFWFQSFRRYRISSTHYNVIPKE